MPPSTSTAAASASASASKADFPANPPPTPSNQTLETECSLASISRFLDNLLLNPSSPPSLSLPPRLSRSLPKPSHPRPPLISLLSPKPDLLLSAASDFGLFHLADHGIPTALSASAALESSPHLHSSPSLAGLGFSDFDEGDADMVFDVLSERMSTMPALSEFARGLERVGMKVMEMLAAAGGFSEDPFGNGKACPRCLIWVSANGSAREEDVAESWEMRRGRNRFPFVLGLQYEMKGRSGPMWVLGDSGEWSAVATRADSVLVTLGDIAQVWSNGRFKKVRGIEHPISHPSDGCDHSEGGVSISLLVTLTMDSTVVPPPMMLESDGHDEEGDGGDKCKRKFQSFAFEEYAWRVYNDRFPFKDPLLRYRI